MEAMRLPSSGRFDHRLKITDSLLVLFTFTLWIATRRLVIGAEDTAERQLRAYAWAQTKPTRNISGNFEIQTIIKNTGQTPAHEVQSWTMTDFFDHPLPSGHAFKSAPAVLVGPEFVVNPGSEHSMNTRRETAIPDDDIAAIEAGTKGLYYWGEVRYRDAFNEIRYSRFRFRWNKEPGAGRGFWSYCDKGNEAN